MMIMVVTDGLYFKILIDHHEQIYYNYMVLKKVAGGLLSLESLFLYLNSHENF